MLSEKNIEFQCKKGGGFESLNTDFYLPKKQNQDNFFIVTDDDLKFFGIFDGHGEFGHLVSGLASGIMLDYIRNKDKAFRLKYLMSESIILTKQLKVFIGDCYDLSIRRALRRCFKYTQKKIKQICKASHIS